MTPDQLERIKAYIGKVRYDQTSRELQSDTIVIPILDTAVGQFIADAVNEKLESYNWKYLAYLLQKCLDESPCDPDIRLEQIKAHEALNEFLKLNPIPSNSKT